MSQIHNHSLSHFSRHHPHRLHTLALFISTITILFAPSVTFAIDESTLEFFSQNGIYYYDPDGANQNCGYGVGSYDGEASAGLSSLQASFVDTYQPIASQLSVEYGIPWETVVAQGILESASGTSSFATERNNFFGIGAFDSNPNNAFSYDSPAEGWRGYYENIKNTPTYRNHGVFQEPNITDPYAYAAAIKAAGYATDPEYVSKLSTLIEAIEHRSAEKGWASSAELAQQYPEMITNAGANSSGTESTESSTDICIGAGNGDLNTTALALSWPDRSHSPDDPKPEYREALAATGVNKLGDSCSMTGKSCDAFVTTVLRYSGVDENATCCGVGNLLSYYLQHPEIYQEVSNTGSTADHQPGDIRINSGHVEMIVQLEDGSFRIASASHCDRTGDHGGNYYADSSYRVFRVTKQGTINE